MSEESSESDLPLSTPDKSGHGRTESLILVNTGHGKGKSTAAFGTLLRAVALDWRVGVVQFLKSGDWRVGEEKVCRQLGVDWFAAGDGFTWDSKDLDETAALAAAAWGTAEGLLSAGDHRLLVFDEISYALAWDWINLDDVVKALQNRPGDVSVILTGRDMPEAIIELANTVTDMKCVKHAFDSGILAKKGIDY